MLGLPGAMVLTSATPAFAQEDPATVNEQTRRWQEKLDGLRNNRIFNEGRASRGEPTLTPLQLIAQLREEVPRYASRVQRDAIPHLITQLNAADYDFDRNPETYDALIDLILVLLEQNRNGDIPLRFVKPSDTGMRVYFSRTTGNDERGRPIPVTVKGSELLGELMTEMNRRLVLANEARGRGRQPESNNENAVETRWTPQITRLYVAASNRGIQIFSRDPLTQQITELRSPNSRQHVRLWIGVVQALGDVPSTNEDFRWAAEQLNQLRNLGHQNQDILNRYIDAAKQKLRERATTELALPRETSIDRNAASTAAVETQTPTTEQTEEQIDRAFPLWSLFLMAVPILAALAGVLRLIQWLRGLGARKKFKNLRDVKLENLVSPKTDFPTPNKLIHALMEISGDKTSPALSRANIPLKLPATFGSYRLSMTRDVFQRENLVATDPIRGISITVVQLGNFLLTEQGRPDPNGEGTISLAIDLATNGSIATIRHIGNYWIANNSRTVKGGIPYYRAYDYGNRREVVVAEVGDFLIQPHSQRRDEHNRNYIYTAINKKTGLQVDVLETGQFLIVNEALADGSFRAWDREANLETALFKFDQYFLMKNLGQGAFGRVDLFWDPSLNRAVAIKQLHATLITDIELVTRFLRESELMATLNHENILPIIKAGKSGQTPFYVMPVVEGDSMDRILKRNGKLPIGETISYGIQTANGLAYIHEHQGKGIVHRDMKPANTFVTQTGYVQIADFGVAHMDANTRSRLTEEGQVFGTIIYMSPEQLNGEPTRRTDDIYALGVMLYQLTAGVDPFEEYHKNMVGMLEAKKNLSYIKEKISKLRGSVPEGFLDILLNALQPDAKDRYATAAQMAADLKALQLDPAKRFPIKRRISKRMQFGLLVASIVTGLVAITAILFALFGKKEPVVAPRQPQVPAVAPQPYLSLQEVEAMPVQQAIDRLTAEITRRPNERETGRSYYYRARVKFQQAQARQREIIEQQAHGNVSGLDRRRDEARAIMLDAAQDLEAAVRLLPDLNQSPRVLILKAQFRMGVGDLDTAERILREAQRLEGLDANLRQEMQQLLEKIGTSRQIGMTPQPIRPNLRDTIFPASGAVEFAA